MTSNLQSIQNLDPIMLNFDASNLEKRGDGNNWYMYANNNPIMNIDPTGLASVDGEYIPDGLVDSGEWNNEISQAWTVTETDGGDYDWSNWKAPTREPVDHSKNIASGATYVGLATEGLSKAGKIGTASKKLGPVFAGIAILADASSLKSGELSKTRFGVNTAITALTMFPPTTLLGTGLTLGNIALGDDIAAVPENFKGLKNYIGDKIYMNLQMQYYSSDATGMEKAGLMIQMDISQQIFGCNND